MDAFYGDILETLATFDNGLIVDAKTTNYDVNINSPFEALEIQQAKDGWTPSAPGPDGITVQEVRNICNDKLGLLFKVVYYRLCIPEAWKTSRTTLIFKDRDRADTATYHTITISSALMRLLHRALAARFKKAIYLSANQRGVTDIDGTVANTTLVQ